METFRNYRVPTNLVLYQILRNARVIIANSQSNLKTEKKKLEGIKEKGCDIKNNYSGNLYSGMHTFVG
jgi:hypothetical protein